MHDRYGMIPQGLLTWLFGPCREATKLVEFILKRRMMMRGIGDVMRSEKDGEFLWYHIDQIVMDVDRVKRLLSYFRNRKIYVTP